MQDIIELMEKYDLTLRRLSSEERGFIECRKGEENHPNAVDVVRTKGITKEKFDFEKSKGWRDSQHFVPSANDPNVGNAVGKMIRYVKTYQPGWLVKIDHSHGNVQRWDFGKTFEGDTAEEAVMKAVEYIEGKK